jgi:hypothetical protein
MVAQSIEQHSLRDRDRFFVNFYVNCLFSAFLGSRSIGWDRRNWSQERAVSVRDHSQFKGFADAQMDGWRTWLERLSELLFRRRALIHKAKAGKPGRLMSR